MLRDSLEMQRHTQAKSEKVKKNILCKQQQREQELLYQAKDTTSETVTRQRKFFLMIKGSILQESIIIITIYAPNIKHKPINIY